MKRATIQAASMAAAALVCGSALAGESASVIKMPGALTAVFIATADAPSAEQVMADAVKAMGGQDAIANIKTLRAVLETSVPGPQGEMKIEMESLWSREGGRLTRTNTPMGAMEMGSDGTVAWVKNPRGYSKPNKQQAEALKNQSSMFMNMLEPQRTAKEEMAKLENTGTEKFADVECYRLHYVNNEGKEGNLFYAVESGLPMGFQRVDANGAPIKMVIGDWKEEQGVKIFRSIESSAANQPAMTLKVTTVEINTLDASTFAVPEGAKALGGDGKPADGAATKPAPGSGSGGEIKLEDLTPEQQTVAKQMLERLRSGGDVAKMKEAVARIEPTLPMISDPAKRKPIEYALQEVKKEIAKAGG